LLGREGRQGRRKLYTVTGSRNGWLEEKGLQPAQLKLFRSRKTKVVILLEQIGKWYPGGGRSWWGGTRIRIPPAAKTWVLQTEPEYGG